MQTKTFFRTSIPIKTVTTCSQVDPQRPRRQRNALQRQRPAQGDRSLTSSTAAASAAAAMPALESVDYQAPHRALKVLSSYRALVLDAAYRPIDVVNWQRAICMDLLKKVDVLEYYEATIASVQEEWQLPAVIKAKWNGAKHQRGYRVAMSRRNILLRDNFQCQYCGKNGGKNASVLLTLDHVVPQSKGGKNSWDNLVTACAPCNSKKGDKTLKQLKWKLRKEPREPSPYDLDLMLSTIGAGDINSLPEEWENYLYYGEIPSKKATWQ